MKNFMKQAWKIIFITTIGFIGSLIAGLMTYGMDIFELQSPGFAYFILYGICTSFIFAFYHIRGLSEAITAGLATGVVLLIIASFWMPITNSVIWSLGVCLSVILIAFLFERKMANLRQWKFTFVGVFYAALFVMLTLLAGILTNVAAMPPKLFQSNFLDGLWLGLGVGLGVEVAESIMDSLDSHKKDKAKKKQQRKK